jgi:hypothetical protein
MLWGRVTYEMMEGYRPAVARGDEAAPPALREWAVKLDAKPKYVVSSTRTDFPVCEQPPHRERQRSRWQSSVVSPNAWRASRSVRRRARAISGILRRRVEPS